MRKRLFYKKLEKIIYRFFIYLQHSMVHYLQKQKLLLTFTLLLFPKEKRTDMFATIPVNQKIVTDFTASVKSWTEVYKGCTIF